MILNHIEYAESKKDQLLKLTFRELRLVAKNLSVRLYSRKNKKELVNLILKYQKKDLIGKQIINREEFSVEIIKEQEKIALENDNAEKENIAIGKANAEKENIAIGKAKAEEERIAIKKAKAKEGKTLISDENSNLKRLLSESFPDKKVSVTDNKDGSQTILIR